MSTVGIICEYNPFHNGHKYHIEKSKEISNADNVVCIMSSSFMQRSECGIINKFKRAECAILNGADLVIELPFIYSTATAELFAKGAVDILSKSNIVDFLSFGSECGDIETLNKTCDILLSDEFDRKLKELLKKGSSFPSARQKALSLFSDNEDILASPNNILAIEYLKAIKVLNSKLKPLTVKRLLVNYNEEKIKDNITSASFARKLLVEDPNSFKKVVPLNVYNIINEEIAKNNALADIRKLDTALLYKLRLMSDDEIKNIFDVSEGFEYRIIKAKKTAKDYNDLIEKLKTKRYTMSKIRRILLYCLLDIDKTLPHFAAPYIRVLAFNTKGRQLISKMQKTAEIPLVIRPKRDIESLSCDAKKVFEKEVLATDIYNLCTPYVLQTGEDYTVPPSYIK